MADPGTHPGLPTAPRVVVATILVAVVIATAAAWGPAVAGAGTATATATATGSAPPPPVRPLAWSACSATSAVQCGTVSVPIDYRHPGRGSMSIAVTRIPALDPGHPGGTLVFNPGGPGESGNEILPLLVGSFPPAVHQRFDLVSFDPRGTGASELLGCGTPPAALTSVLPVPSGPGRPLPGTSVFTAMARACRSRAGALTPFINTTNTARDLDRIRQALGVSAISYYGLSYGTVLGTVYADLFPHRVATMVLDGAVDVNASLVQQATQEAPAVERSLEHLFDTCAATAGCPLGAHPRSTFEAVAAALGRRPLPAPGDGDSTPVTVGDLDSATLLALSVPQLTPQYESAVASAATGDGTPLRSLALTLELDINLAPLGDPLWAITCNDAAVHPGPVAAGTLATSLARRYPLVGAYAVTYTMGGCVSWPRGTEPVDDVHPAHAPPVLVIGNTGDPNTPYVGAVHLATAFPKAALLTWSGWGHTWLLSGAADACMQGLVARYLTGGGLPRRGTVCH
jgi:pimeloyl-ACP methyl ester carboxylesterase